MVVDFSVCVLGGARSNLAINGEGRWKRWEVWGWQKGLPRGLKIHMRMGMAEPRLPRGISWWVCKTQAEPEP